MLAYIQAGLAGMETFKSFGIEFCSFSQQMDTSTPTGKMIFTVWGAVAELERSLIAERVRPEFATHGRKERCLVALKLQLPTPDFVSFSGRDFRSRLLENSSVLSRHCLP